MVNLSTENLAENKPGYLMEKWNELSTKIEAVDINLNDVLDICKKTVIHDNGSALPIGSGEFEDLYESNQLMQYLDGVSESEREIITLIAKTKGLGLEQVIQVHQDGEFMAFKCSSLTELGNYLIDEGFLPYVIPEEVMDFIDMEKLAAAWLNAGKYIDLSDIGFYITY